jgi:imidazolonepropionase
MSDIKAGDSDAGRAGAEARDDSSAEAPWDLLLTDARLATLAADAPGYGAVEPAAIAVRGERIAWLGPMTELPASEARRARERRSLDGRWVTPGLVDCHTHLVHGGDRAREFEQRLHGATYEEIARAGGGIRSTVAATRAADEDALVAAARPRLDALIAEGVTTVEIKSGYGLTVESELRMLRAARRLGAERPVTIRTTLLAAHAIPPEYEGNADAYIDLIIDELLPLAARSGLADAVDAFCERIAFTPEQTARVFEAARRLGLPVKLHADQLSDLGGAALAARFAALSAEHLEYSNEDGIAAMARTGTVAVLLPGAFYFLRETRLPPIQALRRHGVPIAIATDNNPGSSPATSLLLMLNMACTLFRMTPVEALAGATREGARALGLGATHGTLETGKAADLAVWDIAHPAELAYRIGFNPLHLCVRAGKVRA